MVQKVRTGAMRAAPWLAVAGVGVVAMCLLWWEGRPWWCRCGQAFLWTGEPNGPHTSQHLADPYGFIHILHGFAFCGVLAWAWPRLPPSWRLVAAVAVEAAWEVIENSPPVIERYRTATAAVGYRGDTIANSLGDIASCGLGVLVAQRLGLWWSAALFAVMEVVLLVWIRDSFLFSIVMLVWPMEAIRTWQSGA